VKPLKIIRIYLVLFVLGLLFALPFCYAIYTSLLQMKDVDKIVKLSQLTLENYIHLFSSKEYALRRWYTNSIIMTAIIVSGNVVINSMAAFALAKLKFKGQKVVSFIVVATLMIPYYIILMPVYIKMAQLGWLNTFRALTVPYLTQCIYIFLLRQFFVTIPEELLDASRIDGLSKAGSFFYIIVPLSKPAFISMIILNFTGTWNSYIIPSTMTSKQDMYVLVVGLNSLKDQFFERTNIVMTGVVITTISVVILFLFLQKYYVQGLSQSGIKG
jgi:multiple sugar transport system permease protein